MPQTLSEKDQFLESLEREVQTTLRALGNYPPGQEDFRPAPRSRTGRELAWMFVMEAKLLAALSEGQMPSAMPPAPDVSVAELTRTYETIHREVTEKLRGMPSERLDETVKFPIGPGQVGDVRVGQILWMMLMDQVHHRGQLTIYLRMLGAKVPPIYGPSGDEPWR